MKNEVYVNLRPFWNDFMQYKMSKEGKALVRRNKENATQNRYHHHLGSSSYSSVIPKVERMEVEMIAKGVVPQTVQENWSKCSKHWLYGNGGTVDNETGVLD